MGIEFLAKRKEEGKMIKLIEVAIEKYKPIENQQLFKVEDDVTVLVGMNESGKTSILEALAKSNYFDNDEKFKYNLTYDYPRRQKKKVDKNAENPIAVKLKYQIDSELVNLIKNDIGLAPSENTFSIHIKYDNSRDWSISWVDTSEFMKKKVSSLKFGSKEVINKFKKVSNQEQFLNIITEIDNGNLECNEEDIEKVEELKKYFTNTENWNGGPIDYYIINTYLKDKIPKFMYYDDYYSLPSEISLMNINDNLENSSVKTAKALLELADINLSTVRESDNFEEFIAELEATESIISDELFKYWKTNRNLNIEFRINKVEKRDYGNHSIIDRVLNIRVKNQRTGVSLSLENRSKGFNWFFSFLVWFKKIQENRDTTYILLLDEPGLNLHAKAQNDLLKFISDLSKNYQIIYTTHSPFMIETNSLNKVRTVYETKDGTIISDSVQEKDPNTLFPLQAALGYDLAQNLFISEKNLLVEGISDLTYLSIISTLLQNDGREGLSADVKIVPIGGADKVATFISLLRGNKLKMVCLLDTFTNQSAEKRLNNMVSKKIIRESNILFYHDILNSEYADIEDLFKKEDYINLYNGAFKSEVDANKMDKGSILNQLKKLNNADFNHYVPANYFAVNVSNTKLSDETLDNFENLFKKINRLMK